MSGATRKTKGMVKGRLCMLMEENILAYGRMACNMDRGNFMTLLEMLQKESGKMVN